jgi:hypothetical protein
VKLRTVLRIVALAAWLLAAAPIAATFGADSGAPPDYGWWNKQQAVPVQGDPTGVGLTTVPTVPAPATVPPDGIYVASDGSGPSAIAALRYAAGGGGTLTLQLAEGTTLTGTEKVVACPVQGGFTPTQNGAWAARPGYDETACVVEGQPAADGSSFSFEIPASFASALGDVSMVITSAPGATPFSLPFDKPADDSFLVTSPVTPSSSDSGSDAVSSYDPGSSGYAAPSPSSSGSSPSFAAPSTPAGSAPSASGGGGQAAVPVVPAALPAALRPGSRSDQVAAVLALVLIGGAFWVLSNRPQRLPRLLGSVGGHAEAADAVAAATVRTSRPRGVGRFARHRSAPPTAI